jgi:hypothetical protein
MSMYQLALLGAPGQATQALLLETLGEMIRPFGLTLDGDLAVLDAGSIVERDIKDSFVAAYFATPGLLPSHETALRYVVSRNLPVIPVVDDLRRFQEVVPLTLRGANGMQLGAAGAKLEGLAAALLECLGLLRRQRRVFISYRRDEAADAALQLHEELGAHGFDVFLDTFDVRPAEDFQAVLWHRLCDCDVMIMLDTPGYFGSRWTAGEIGRALAKKIAVLGVVWPGHEPARRNQLRQPIILDPADLLGPGGPLAQKAVERIRIESERLRSRSLAIRHASLAGALRAGVEDIGGTVQAAGVHRTLTIVLPDGRRVLAFPAVGVPSAEILYDAVEHTDLVSWSDAPVLVYDPVGLHSWWQSHLSWLEKNLRGVRLVEVGKAAWQFADWRN